MKTDQPLVTVPPRDGVAILDHVAGPEQVGASGEEHFGDLARLPTAEMALDVRKPENVQAQRIHHHRAGLVRDTEVTDIDQTVKIICSKTHWVADSLALRPAEHRGTSQPCHLRDHTTHRTPTLLR